MPLECNHSLGEIIYIDIHRFSYGQPVSLRLEFFFLNWTTWPDFKMLEVGASENNPIINDSLDTEDLYCCYPNFVSIHVIFSQKFFQISVDHRKITNTLHYFVSPRDPVGEIQLNAQWFSVFHVKWKTLLSKLRWLTSI